MISMTVTRKYPDWATVCMQAINGGALSGIGSGAIEMASVARQNAHDYARYPEGGLESEETTFMDMDSIVERGNFCSVQVVSKSDHARAFEEGTKKHFVPAATADHRIVDGCYPHITPVYGKGKNSGYDIPDESTGDSGGIIGYMASGGKHPYMEDAFNATTDYTVNEVRNFMKQAYEMT